MYASRRRYVKQYDFQKPEDRYVVTVTKGGKPAAGIRPELISYIVEESMYWRKANHIHQWFVANVQDGKDDCGTYYVPREKLIELRATCKRVLDSSPLVTGKVYQGTTYDRENPKGKRKYATGKVLADTSTAEELLPTQEGFFFGNTEYDEHYFKDVEDTYNWLNELLDDPEYEAWSVYYSSSW